MTATIGHLFEHPALTETVARAIHAEFWQDRPGGMTVDDLLAHLHTAVDPGRIPLCLVARVDGEFAGTVNLIHNDDDKRAHLHPWLAAMVVTAPRRGQGIGSGLVRALLAEAARLGIDTLYFGTDGPGFYTRLGAVLHEQVNAEFCIMKIRTV